MDDLKKYLEQQFKNIDENFKNIDENFKYIDENFKNINDKLEKMDIKLQLVHGDLKGTKQQMDDRFDDVLTQQRRTNRHIDWVENDLDHTTKRVDKLEKEIKQ